MSIHNMTRTQRDPKGELIRRRERALQNRCKNNGSVYLTPAQRSAKA